MCVTTVITDEVQFNRHWIIENLVFFLQHCQPLNKRLHRKKIFLVNMYLFVISLHCIITNLEIDEEYLF